MKMLTWEAFDAAGDSDDADWTENLFYRIHQALSQIEELHRPFKIWESDKAYTLVCKLCQLTSYPCETVKVLGVDWKGDE